MCKPSAAVEAQWGGIDVLVNNAGVCQMAPIVQVTREDYRCQFDVNVGGTLCASQAVVPSMRERAIINVASQAGRRGEASITVCCATKAAVIFITQSLARELARDNIRVNAIAPDVINTPMWDMVDAQFAAFESRPRAVI